MDYFDPFADEDLAVARLTGSGARLLVVSFDSDWRFPTAHSIELARVLDRTGCVVHAKEVASPLRARLLPAHRAALPRARGCVPRWRRGGPVTLACDIEVTLLYIQKR